MTHKILPSIILSVIAIACCGPKNAASNEKTMEDNFSYKKIAEEKFDNNYSVSFNSDSTFLICYSKDKKPNTVFPPLKYFIYDNKNNKIIFQESLANGKVKWINDRQILVSYIPGIIKGNEEDNSTSYIYDVKLKKKIQNNIQKLDK